MHWKGLEQREGVQCPNEDNNSRHFFCWAGPWVWPAWTAQIHSKLCFPSGISHEGLSKLFPFLGWGILLIFHHHPRASSALVPPYGQTKLSQGEMISNCRMQASNLPGREKEGRSPVLKGRKGRGGKEKSPTHLPGHSKLGDLPAGHALGQPGNLWALLAIIKLGQLQPPERQNNFWFMCSQTTGIHFPACITACWILRARQKIWDGIETARGISQLLCCL